VRRSTRVAFLVAWPVFVLAVVLAWRKVSAAPDGDVNGLFVATVCGLVGMLLLTKLGAGAGPLSRFRAILRGVRTRLTPSGRRPWWRVWRSELVIGAVVAGLIVVGVVGDLRAEDQQDSRCRLPPGAAPPPGVSAGLMNAWYDACYKAEQVVNGE
jgi:hypothetical protein